MRRPTPLMYASPPSARTSASKRRRLNHAVDPGCQSGRALTDSSNVAPTPNAPSPPSSCAKFACSTCHRALSTAIRPGVAGPLVCARCATPTCAICARTCTSYTCPPSIPPTPALTRSPSPSTRASTPVSPRRPLLGLGCAAMNCDVSVALPPTHAIKRKHAPVHKEDGDGGGGGGIGDDDGRAGRDHHDGVSVHESVREGRECVVVHGCGRIVCRACCVESVSNDGTLCVDCFVLV